MSPEPEPEPEPQTSQTRPLYEIIYGVLREHLLDGSLPRGLVLGEAGVARAFGSSRIPAAAALQRLSEEGLLKRFDGRGYVGRDADTSALIRRELSEVGFRLPETVQGDLDARSHQQRIYPEVEHVVAACLGYGRFLVNETALGEFYGVSRTVAHEILTGLDRMGLIEKDRNQRWYAGPMTVDRLREHFEMRWLLEPTALGQAMAAVTPAELEAKRARVEAARNHPNPPGQRERLERDLHVDTVLACANRQLRDTLRRNALPLIVTHSAFAGADYGDEIETMLGEHQHIYDLLLAGRKAEAMAALEAHIRRSLAPNIVRLEHLGPLPASLSRPFLVQAEEPRRG